MPKPPILLTDEIKPPPALIRAGIEALPAIVRAQGERARRRFIEFFTASIRNRNTRTANAHAVKQFFDWCDEHRLELHEIEAITVAAYIEQLGNQASKPTVKPHLAAITQLSAGSKSSTVTIFDNAGNANQVIPLTGKGNDAAGYEG